MIYVYTVVEVGGEDEMRGAGGGGDGIMRFNIIILYCRAGWYAGLTKGRAAAVNIIRLCTRLLAQQRQRRLYYYYYYFNYTYRRVCVWPLPHQQLPSAASTDSVILLLYKTSDRHNTYRKRTRAQTDTYYCSAHM